MEPGEEALALGPPAADLYANLGLALYELGRIAEAEASYAEALRLTPGLPEALNNLGVIRFQAGRYAEAAELFRRALSSRPGYEDAAFNLRDTLAELGGDA